MANTALQFDGSQNYFDLGTMGSFGSSLGSNFYADFYMRTTSTALGFMGTLNTGSTTGIFIGFNEDSSQANVAGKMFVFLRGDNAGTTSGATTNSCAINDGGIHHITITVVPSTNTITITVDSVSQSITYTAQTTPSTFSNFGFTFLVGARHNRATIDGYFNFTIDNLLLGTSASSLFGSYAFNEGAGTTTADLSGQSNTGTLTGSPAPIWTTGIPLAKLANSGVRPRSFAPGLAR